MTNKVYEITHFLLLFSSRLRSIHAYVDAMSMFFFVVQVVVITTVRDGPWVVPPTCSAYDAYRPPSALCRPTENVWPGEQPRKLSNIRESKRRSKLEITLNVSGASPQKSQGPRGCSLRRQIVTFSPSNSILTRRHETRTPSRVRNLSRVWTRPCMRAYCTVR